MNSFWTIVTAVTLGNIVSVVLATYVNSILSKRDAKRRQAEIQSLIDNLEHHNEIFDKPIKKVKKPVSKSAKKQ